MARSFFLRAPRFLVPRGPRNKPTFYTLNQQIDKMIGNKVTMAALDIFSKSAAASNKHFAIATKLGPSRLKMTHDLYKSDGFQTLDVLIRAEQRRRRDYIAMTMGMTGMVGIGFFA